MSLRLVILTAVHGRIRRGLSAKFAGTSIGMRTATHTARPSFRLRHRLIRETQEARWIIQEKCWGSTPSRPRARTSISPSQLKTSAAFSNPATRRPRRPKRLRGHVPPGSYIEGRNQDNTAGLIQFDTNCDGKADRSLFIPDNKSEPISALIDSNFDDRVDTIVEEAKPQTSRMKPAIDSGEKNAFVAVLAEPADQPVAQARERRQNVDAEKDYDRSRDVCFALVSRR